MIEMEEAIRRTIERMETTTAARGTNDCGAIMGAYVEMLRGVNPFDGLFGTYDDAEGAHELIARAGGITAITRTRMKPLGIEMHANPKRGDLVTAVVRGEPAVGLHLGPRTSFKTAHGRAQMRVPIEGAWTCA